MAKKQTQKPAQRKATRSAKAGSGRVAGFGWVAAVAVAGAWVAFDRFPEATDPVMRGVELVREAIVPSNESGRPAKLAAAERRSKPADERFNLITGSIPTPQKRTAVSASTQADAPKPTIAVRPSMPIPRATALPPLEKPSLEAALQPSRPANAPVVAAPSPAGGVQRHATRALAAHEKPDGASAASGRIGSGSSVLVLRSVGEWRYVRDTRSDVEGWVDGRFLAGEAAAADLAAFRPPTSSPRR